MTGDEDTSRLSAHQRATIIKAVGTAILVGLPVFIFAVALLLSGPINAIAYTILFLLGLTLLPVGVMLLQGGMPDVVGRVLFALGQLAAGEGWLVQHDAEWRMHPGRTVDGKRQVYLFDEWRDVEDTRHQTRLAWQPFGIIWSKAEGDLEYAREAAASDGGAEARAGQSAVPAERSRQSWTVAMHRYLTDGLKKIGDIAILSTIEEVTERKASRSDGSTAKGALIGSIVGLVLGIMTGYVAVFGV